MRPRTEVDVRILDKETGAYVLVLHETYAKPEDYAEAFEKMAEKGDGELGTVEGMRIVKSTEPGGR